MCISRIRWRNIINWLRTVPAVCSLSLHRIGRFFNRRVGTAFSPSLSRESEKPLLIPATVDVRLKGVKWDDILPSRNLRSVQHEVHFRCGKKAEGTFLEQGCLFHCPNIRAKTSKSCLWLLLREHKIELHLSFIIWRAQGAKKSFAKCENGSALEFGAVAFLSSSRPRPILCGELLSQESAHCALRESECALTEKDWDNE